MSTSDFSNSLLAIDPGASGGFALLDRDQLTLINMPGTLADQFRCIQQVTEGCLFPPIVLMEDVGYHVQGNDAQHSATFARHCGHIEMALCVSRHRKLLYITPGIWMRHVLNRQVPRGRTERKTKIFNTVGARYPGIAKLTRKTSDALGILVYGMEVLFPLQPTNVVSWTPKKGMDTDDCAPENITGLPLPTPPV